MTQVGPQVMVPYVSDDRGVLVNAPMVAWPDTIVAGGAYDSALSWGHVVDDPAVTNPPYVYAMDFPPPPPS